MLWITTYQPLSIKTRPSASHLNPSPEPQRDSVGAYLPHPQFTFEFNKKQSDKTDECKEKLKTQIRLNSLKKKGDKFGTKLFPIPENK